MPRARNADADRLANQAMDAAAEPSGRESRPGRDPAARDPAPRPGPGWTRRERDPRPRVLLRHGETPLSAERRFAGRGDIPLTETGLLQAAAAAERLAARGGIDLIVTSPLQRARQTAEAVAPPPARRVEVDDGWLETDFGEWEGLSFAEAIGALAGRGVRLDGRHQRGAARRGELRRVQRPRLRRAGPAAGGRARPTVLWSATSPRSRPCCRHALLAPPAALLRMHLDVASLCEIDWYADGPAVVRSLNDTAHLHPAGRAVAPML